MVRALDLTGKVFGRLKVFARQGSTPAGKALWLCFCECGNSRLIASGTLQNGHTVSCGCYRQEVTAGKSTTHGMSKRPEYRVWKALWARCTNPANCRYELYQFRTPPKRWLKFENFIADMGPRPSNKYSIERRDNDKPYGPSNCYWATDAQQRANRPKKYRRKKDVEH